MGTAEQPIRLRWLLKFGIFLLLALLLFFIALIKNASGFTGAIEPLVIWTVLFLVFVLIRAKFSISFRPEGLYVTQLGKQSLISYANIVQIYTNQDIVDKLIGSGNLLLKIDLPPDRILGMPVVYGVGFPGIRGNIVTIPGLKQEDVIRIRNKLLSYNKNLTTITDLGLGYAYYNKVTLITNSFTIGLLIYTVILLLILGAIYLYLKLILKL